MLDWLHNLPVAWMAVVVFAAAYLVAGVIWWLVTMLASGRRAPAFKAVSPGMLPPLGIIFGLFIAFIAAQVWGDFDRARGAVNREASALRAAVLLAGNFPGDLDARVRVLIRHHIENAVTREWPTMAGQHVTLALTSPPLVEALHLTFSLVPAGNGQVVAQRELSVALQDALEARRQRILISGATVNWVKWTGLVAQAIVMLVAIAMVHSDNRTTAALALAMFTTGAAISVLLIASHNRPFTGEISVRPDVLLQVMPEDRPPAPSR